MSIAHARPSADHPLPLEIIAKIGAREKKRVKRTIEAFTRAEPYRPLARWRGMTDTASRAIKIGVVVVAVVIVGAVVYGVTRMATQPEQQQDQQQEQQAQSQTDSGEDQSQQKSSSRSNSNNNGGSQSQQQEQDPQEAQFQENMQLMKQQQQILEQQQQILEQREQIQQQQREAIPSPLPENAPDPVEFGDY